MGMYVYERRRARLRDLLREVTASDLSDRSQIAASTFSRYLKEPGTKGAKNMSEVNARKIERAARKPEGWLDKPATSDVPHTGGDTPIRAWHGPMSARMIDPVAVAWESIPMQDLPAVFTVVMPDDALAPEFRKGQVVAFSRHEGEPRPDDAVLVADQDGRWHARIYRARRQGHFQAVALASGFDPLDSADDGLTVVAIAMAKWGRRGQ